MRGPTNGPRARINGGVHLAIWKHRVGLCIELRLTAWRHSMRSLAKLSLGQLEAEISRRKRGGQSLLRKRAKLAAKLASLDQRLADLGLRAGSNGHTSGKRPRNETSLVEALGKVLKGKTMSIGDAMAAVQKAGYRSSAKNFRSVVSIALTQSGKFKRVDRGQYTAK